MESSDARGQPIGERDTSCPSDDQYESNARKSALLPRKPFQSIDQVRSINMARLWVSSKGKDSPQSSSKLRTSKVCGRVSSLQVNGHPTLPPSPALRCSARGAPSSKVGFSHEMRAVASPSLYNFDTPIDATLAKIETSNNLK